MAPPPYPSRSSVGPGGQQDQEQGVVLHDQEEGYQHINHPKLLELRVAKYLKVSVHMTPLPTQVVRWTVRSRTFGSST